MNQDIIFRTFDIRGKYPEMINEDVALRLGYCLGRMAKGKIAVGCDNRASSKKIVKPFISGLNLASKNEITFLGEIPTEMIYFASGFLKFDLGIEITASHCQWEETGFKICRKNANSFGPELIKKLKNEFNEQPPISFKEPSFNFLDLYPQYINYILKIINPLEIKGNVLILSFGGLCERLYKQLFSKFKNLKFKIKSLKEDLKGLPPNPLLEENRENIKKYAKFDFDLIAASDGDGDRVIFFEPKNGDMILPDFTAGILAETLLEKKRGPIVFDCRKRIILSKVADKFKVPFYRTKAGYPFIKKEARKRRAIFGGEASGHYFYPQNFYSESSVLTILYFISYLNKHGKNLNDIELFKESFSLPEENFKITNFSKIKNEFLKEFKNSQKDFIDGLTLWSKDWYLNIRPSQNEPLIRLNLEARDKNTLNIIYKKARKVISKVQKLV